METIKRTVRVTIEKEIEVELTPAVFGRMTKDEYLAEFRKCLWHVDDIDDVVKYAARCAAYGPVGVQEYGLGLINDRDSNYPRKGDVLVHEISDDCECEIL
ncbi:MAG: hypothetical protein KDH16_12270 [Rhodocyclaceae bacterium]|nr:hypothetical protein [Rhodocyclaceae bacterium]